MLLATESISWAVWENTLYWPSQSKFSNHSRMACVEANSTKTIVCMNTHMKELLQRSMNLSWMNQSKELSSVCWGQLANWQKESNRTFNTSTSAETWKGNYVTCLHWCAPSSSSLPWGQGKRIMLISCAVWISSMEPKCQDRIQGPKQI